MTSKGLSMIEIIVSVALIGIIATGLLSVSTSYVSMLFDSKEITQDLMYAQQDIEKEIEKVKNQIEDGIIPLDEDSYILFDGTSYKRTIKGYPRKESIYNNPGDIDGNRGILYTIITDNTIEYKTAQASNVEIKLWTSEEVADGYANTTGLNIRSKFNLSDPDNVNLTTLNRWYVTREGYNIPVRYEPFEVEIGSKFPRFPDDYFIISTEKLASLNNIREEYAGKHILYAVTPASKSGKMGSTVPSNPVFISGLPVISDLVLHLDASMIDVTSSHVRIDGNDTFVKTWYDQSKYENDGKQNIESLQPKLFDDKFGVFQGTHSKVYDTYARYVRFENNTSIIVSDDTSLDLNNMTIYAVVRSDNKSTVKSIIEKNNSSEGWYLGWTAASHYGFQIWSEGLSEFINGNYNEGIDNEWHILRADTSMEFKIDQGTANSYTKTLGTIVNGSPIIIKWNDSSGYVDVAEIIVYSGHLTTTEKQGIDKYLNNKYHPVPPIVVISSLETPSPISLIKDETFLMPSTLVANMSNGTKEDVEVSWTHSIDTTTPGLKTSLATAELDTSKTTTLAVTVHEIASLVDIHDSVMQGRPYIMPTVVEAILNDGSSDLVETIWTPSNLSSASITDPLHPLESIGRSILDSSKTLTLYLDIVPIGVESVSMNIESIDITKDLTYDIIATVLPSDSPDKSITWTSNNPAVASVDINGRVKANLEGTTIITVTTIDGGFIDTCEVTVIP